MSAIENKLNLVQLIVESEDKTFVTKLLEYARSLKKQNSNDWIEGLPEHVFNELKLAIEEADNGTDLGISHEVMLAEARKSFPHLNL